MTKSNTVSKKELRQILEKNGTIEDGEVESIYDRICGNYPKMVSSMQEATDTKTIVHTVKRVILNGAAANLGKISRDNRPSIEEQRRILKESMKMIIEGLAGLTPDEYCKLYCAKINDMLKVDNLKNDIISLAPVEMLTECCFDSKRILFKSVFPEYYEENFPKIIDVDIFFASGELKSGMKHRARPLNEFEMDNKSRRVNYGNEIDKIIYDNVRSLLMEKSNYDYKDVMFFFSNWELLVNNAKSKKPGFYEIIEERGCYEHPLDFFFFNSPFEEQVKYMDEYVQNRNSIKSLAKNPQIDFMYKAFCENRGYFYDKAGLEYKEPDNAEYEDMEPECVN